MPVEPWRKTLLRCGGGVFMATVMAAPTSILLFFLIGIFDGKLKDTLGIIMLSTIAAPLISLPFNLLGGIAAFVAMRAGRRPGLWVAILAGWLLLFAAMFFFYGPALLSSGDFAYTAGFLGINALVCSTFFWRVAVRPMHMQTLDPATPPV